MPISLFGGRKREYAKMLEEGWQLYKNPTTQEPVGTLFRIDEARRRFMVDQVTVDTNEGAEAVAKVQQKIQANIGFFANFLGLDRFSGKLNVEDIETLEFEIINSVRQFSFDTAMDRAMAPVLASLNYRIDNRYYVIRETRSATAMTYRLTQAQLGAIGGEMSLSTALGVNTTIGAGQKGFYEINQTFPERMRVMFLAEEIAPVKAGLAGDKPMLGRIPVRHPLVWSEG
ncbi:hypothetical protein SAMN04489760_1122 [Syntrophus gentianae]|uniref:Uncharacterized protein n=1 Tax=Syntrophus gentianae TaxID=43775 RepID=A0A1H7XSI0_9BACT|nr:hypothetical protein [Syntrophus gentianae]SEM36604.1 hypothetical protein SAMN04489760_1122 [Syntrophus gentianae]